MVEELPIFGSWASFQLKILGRRKVTWILSLKESDTRFSTSDFFHTSVSPGPFQIFSKIRGDIREWMFISGVNNTSEKREKILKYIFFSMFCWELSLVHCTPKDWIFAYFLFLDVGKLILAGLFNRRCRWHCRIIVSLTPVNSFSAVSLTPAKNFRLLGYCPVTRINRRCQRHCR